MTAPTTSADVAVVGGGVIGSACAWFLSRVGARVALLEKSAIGSGSSTHATGAFSLSGADFRPGSHLALGVESDRLAQELIPELQDSSGIDVLYQRRPSLRVALDEEEEQYIRAALEWQSRMFPIEWIDADDVRAMEPRLTPKVRGAAFEEASGQLDSGRFTLALAVAAERAGATVLLRKATGLIVNGDLVAGVYHEGGTLIADSVVLATGAWTAEVSNWIGLQLPIRPLRGERLMLSFDGAPLGAIVFSPKRGHLISRRDGYLSTGSTAGRDFDERPRDSPSGDPEHFTSQPTEAALLELVTRAAEVLPSAADARVVQHLAGVRPFTDDRLPLLGAVPGIRNLYLATGHGTKGIHLATGTAKLMSDLVLRGQTDLPIEVEAFSPARRIGVAASPQAVLDD